MDLEKSIRKIDGKEYVVVSSPFGLLYVQDFIRYPTIVVPKGTSVTSRPFGFGSDMQLLENHLLPDISSIVSQAKRSIVFGLEEHVPGYFHDDCVTIGIHSAVLSPLSTYSLIADPESSLLQKMRKVKDLPIGIFRADVLHLMAKEWMRKSNAGLFKLPTFGLDFVNTALPNITTQLHAFDCCAGAINASISLFQAYEVLLIDADLTVSEEKKLIGMIDVGGGRWIWPDFAWTLSYLDAVCHIVFRNGGSVYYLDGTMAPLQSANVVDNDSWSASEGDR